MKLFVYCAGDFGREVCDSVRRLNNLEFRWDEISFIDDDEGLGTEFYGTKLLSFRELLRSYDLSAFEVLVANGESAIRKAIYNKLKSNNVRLATLVDATAIVSDTASLGKGVILTPYCSVSSEAIIGDNVAVNTKAIIGHDVKVGNHSVVSSMVNIGGACSIGEDSYIGMGAQIKEGGIMIGKEVIVGMGSVVYDDIPDGMIALGNPARPMRRNVDKKVFRNSK